VANVVEIIVTGKNLTKPEFEAAVRDARGIGQQVGDRFTTGLGERVKQGLPPAVEAPVKETAARSGAAFSRTFMDTATVQLGQRGIFDQSLGVSLGASGKPAGEKFTATFDKAVKDSLTQSTVAGMVEPTSPVGEKITEDAKKTGEKSGKAAGAGFGAGASPLILGAFAGAATIGPAALLAGTAGAIVGISALIAKSNTNIATDYATLGHDVMSTLTGAIAPVVPQIENAITVLDQGVATLAPQLTGLFQAVAPDATALASGLVQIAQGVLPGLTTGMQAVAPIMSSVAADFGKIAQGAGGFIAGLGGGVGGASQGLGALATSLQRILPELGQLVGQLATGLGPALADVLPLADGTAKALTLVTQAIPPGAIQAAALAVGALFAAFKIGTLAKVVEEGTSFTKFLTGAGIASEAAAGKMALASRAAMGLGTALEVATGPLGMIVGGAGLLGAELGKLSGVGDHTAVSVSALTDVLAAAGQGSGTAQEQIAGFADALGAMMKMTGNAPEGINSLDQALTQLYQTNPAQAAKDYQAVATAWQAQGKSASDVANLLPQYTSALESARLANQGLSGSMGAGLTPAQAFTQAVIGQQQKLAQAAGAADINAAAMNSMLPVQDQLTTSALQAASAYQQASQGANSYKGALDAMYGKYGDLTAAQAQFTTDLGNAAKQLKAGADAVDVNTQAGSANLTVLTGLAKANENVAVNLFNTGKGSDAATRALQQGALAIDALAKKAGFSDQQIQQLNTDLYGVPDVKDIVFTADTGPADRALNGLIQRIDSSTGTVQIYGSGGGRALGGQAHGGVVGGIGAAASGGVRGALTLVGEQGPEVVRLPFGSTVVSAPDTQAMLAGGAGRGGGGVLQLEWVGGNAGDAFMTWLRGNIRVKYGSDPKSVQKALGQTF
jgi:hypothetical protein